MFCTWCFLDYFEKRVKRALRLRELKKGQKVLIVGELAAYLFRTFVHVPLIVRFGKRWKDADFSVIEWTEDDEAVAFFGVFGENFKMRKNDDLKILQFLSDQDALDYAQIKHISFTSRKKDKDWLAFVMQFDDHPEMKHTLVRNISELRKLQ